MHLTHKATAVETRRVVLLPHEETVKRLLHLAQRIQTLRRTLHSLPIGSEARAQIHGALQRCRLERDRLLSCASPATREEFAARRASDQQIADRLLDELQAVPDDAGQVEPEEPERWDGLA